MQLFLKRLKGDPVLLAAWGLALVSAFLVPPDREWLGYVDFHTLGLLFCLMLVMAGLQDIGFFQRLGEGILGRTRTARQLELVLVLLCFFTAMLITNDVALITFVPFAGAVLGMAGLTDRIVPVVVFQTVAANLGSMATPVGNPQNLYLYSHYGVPLGEFFGAVLPFAGLSLVLLTGALLMRRSAPLPEIPSTAGQLPPARGQLLCYLGLFLLSLAAVAKLIPVLLLVPMVMAAILLIDHRLFARVDYGLLLTFAGFFIFIGNVGRIPAFRELFASLLAGREVYAAALVSQVISNVPAALLLSGFTDNARALLIGTNLGGLGTLIASMASLISYKYIALSFPEKKGKYLGFFTAVNLLFLAVLLVFCHFVMA